MNVGSSGVRVSVRGRTWDVPNLASAAASAVVYSISMLSMSANTRRITGEISRRESRY
jgi:hypothetical protein